MNSGARDCDDMYGECHLHTEIQCRPVLNKRFIKLSHPVQHTPLPVEDKGHLGGRRRGIERLLHPQGGSD